MSIYDFSVVSQRGEKVSLEEYKGKVVLIINSATECGFTPQYDELQKLYEKYGEKDFIILDFPCNQFGNQAPGTDEEIHAFCDTKFGITFPIFSKLEVNGTGQDPLFAYLKGEKGFAGFDPEHPLSETLHGILSKQDPDYEKKSDIKWNFTKFLVDRNGKVVERFEPTTNMGYVEEKIKEQL